jgi:hypothetical protein
LNSLMTSSQMSRDSKLMMFSHDQTGENYGDLPSEAYTTASTRRVAKDPARADLVRCEDGGEFLFIVSKLLPECAGVTYMLVHVLGNVGYVKIGVALVGELLELGVERFLGRVSRVHRA